MLFPLPVGPTIATVSPGSIAKSTLCSAGWSSTYSKQAPASSTRPSRASGITGEDASGSASALSSTSKTRPALARPVSRSPTSRVTILRRLFIPAR